MTSFNFQVNTTDCRQLDYVLISKSHLKLDHGRSSTEVRILRTDNEWKDHPAEKALWELSDHFPIYASLYFTDRTKEIIPPNDGAFPALNRMWDPHSQEIADVKWYQEIMDNLLTAEYQFVGEYGYLFSNEQEVILWMEAKTNNDHCIIQLT